MRNLGSKSEQKQMGVIMVDVAEIENGLAQMIGTENYYRHWLGIRFTDGVKYLAENAKAYWLIDAIASYWPRHRMMEFQVWRLVVTPEIIGDIRRTPAVLTMQEDFDKENPERFPFHVRQEIEYTTFPLFEIKLYLIDGVLMLPSEY